MKKFRLQPIKGWYIDKNSSNKKLGHFLHQPVHAFFHEDYHAGDPTLRNTVGTVEYIITTLKNQFLNQKPQELEQASCLLIEILNKDLPKILSKTQKKELTICVVPRAKTQYTYQENQLLFKRSVQRAINSIAGFEDGTDFILRHTDTQTTHLAKSGHGGNGDLPYPQITKNTCQISPLVQGRNILLIDDLYTESVNIDEDALQALLDFGANSVYLYTIGKTKTKNIFSDYNHIKLWSTTLKETFQYMSQNLSIEEIAQLRELTVSTIVSHIVDIADILGSDAAIQYKPNDDILSAVKTAVYTLGESNRLKPIYLELEEKISYDDIKLSLIFVDEM